MKLLMVDKKLVARNGNLLATDLSPTGGGIMQPVTLYASNWVDNTQTVAVEGATADNNILIGASGEPTAFAEAGVYCSAQADGSLTFKCTTTPTEDIVASVYIGEIVACENVGENVGGGGGLKSITFDQNNSNVEPFISSNLDKVRKVKLQIEIESGLVAIFEGIMYNTGYLGLGNVYSCDCINVLLIDSEVQGVVEKGINEQHAHLFFANNTIRALLYSVQWEAEIGGSFQNIERLLEAYEFTYSEFSNFLAGSNSITFYYE